MNERIRKLTEKTLAGEMWVEPVRTEYDREDLFLSPIKMSCKRVCEYILNQEPMIREESALTGFIRFDGSVEGDIFSRSGHRNFALAMEAFYNRPVDNLATFEWQHSVGDFEKIVRGGLTGMKEEITASKKRRQDDAQAMEFLETQEDFCVAASGWALKCSDRAARKAEETDNEAYRENLKKLAAALKKVPESPAESFYEAVLCVYVCYSFVPDSIGLIDRYLYPFYTADMERGTLSRETAKEYLQELFLMLQAKTHISSDRFYRGGESHFCIGGYLENGEDGFNELSQLIVEALMELPTYCPQISLRWTRKTPRETFARMLDWERKDVNKRIAFVNDEPRLRGLMEHQGLSYKEAVSYTMLGCNEIALPGGMVFGFDMINVLRSVENVFYRRKEEIQRAENFEAFYGIYEEELFKDLWEAERIMSGFQRIRSRDCNIVSNIFIEGCIHRARSITQGGTARYLAVGMLIGITNVIDALSVTSQFIFDEKTVTMEELIHALESNWKGYEDLHTRIMKKGDFFGNDDDRSNGIARRFMKSLEKWNNTDNYLGKKWMFGNLIGYNQHYKFFGDGTRATPDGRFAGDMISFGIGQSEGRDRNGLAALLHSIAACDPDAVLTGPSVTNLLIDEQLIRKEENFDRMVSLLETYFEMGGTHFQLNYVSREDLENAQKTPEKYRSLRVRVSGFSDFFNNLNTDLQDEIILRTQHTA